MGVEYLRILVFRPFGAHSMLFKSEFKQNHKTLDIFIINIGTMCQKWQKNAILVFQCDVIL